jgi:hypothetical protein
MQDKRNKRITVWDCSQHRRTCPWSTVGTGIRVRRNIERWKVVIFEHLPRKVVLGV